MWGHAQKHTGKGGGSTEGHVSAFGSILHIPRRLVLAGDFHVRDAVAAVATSPDAEGVRSHSHCLVWVSFADEPQRVLCRIHQEGRVLPQINKKITSVVPRFELSFLLFPVRNNRFGDRSRPARTTLARRALF